MTKILNMTYDAEKMPKVIVSIFATEMRQVNEDVRLSGRGFVIHRRINKAIPAAYRTSDNNILIHPEIEQRIRDTLTVSIERDINAMFLGGKYDK